jgi:hypothetical protein
LQSKYNGNLIAKLASIFADMEERREKREESLPLIQASNKVFDLKSFI